MECRVDLRALCLAAGYIGRVNIGTRAIALFLLIFPAPVLLVFASLFEQREGLTLTVIYIGVSFAGALVACVAGLCLFGIGWMMRGGPSPATEEERMAQMEQHLQAIDDLRRIRNGSEGGPSRDHDR